MHALIPLLLIFIAFNSKQLKEDMWYRANVFALVGISYFFLFHYTLYWYRIFPSDSWLQYLPGLLTISSTVAIALSSWNRKSHPVKTISLVFLCCFAIVSTLSFDYSIKEKLAEWGGYFDSGGLRSGVISTAAAEPIIASDAEKLSMVGIRLDVLPGWQRHRLESGHLYFTENRNDKRLLEVRPNCLGDMGIDTPTFMANTLSQFEADISGTQQRVQCSMSAKDKQCLITVNYRANNSIVAKWRWLNIVKGEGRAIIIDALFYEDSATLKDDVRNVLSSTKLLPQAPTQECHTPAAWL